jgi:hypothetical protein
VFPARFAEFPRFHAVGMLLPVLHRGVVPVFALVALQRDDFAHLSPSPLTRPDAYLALPLFNIETHGSHVAPGTNHDPSPLLADGRDPDSESICLSHEAVDALSPCLQSEQKAEV